ncbi:MAG: serine/threonine-protein phosphatase, partial [Firmicutes bacterium]|nr:serine/threonine-protein phosphatase [Bacillota bacterium]
GYIKRASGRASGVGASGGASGRASGGAGSSAPGGVGGTSGSGIFSGLAGGTSGRASAGLGDRVASLAGVEIIHSGALPLGILEEMRPTIVQKQIAAGDIIILVTDGVQDAFKDETLLADFIRLNSSLNPQTLAEDILAQAISLNKGKPQDDMTVLVGRVFSL